ELAGFDEGVKYPDAELSTVPAAARLFGRDERPINIDAHFDHVAGAKLCNGERDFLELRPFRINRQCLDGRLPHRYRDLLGLVREKIRASVVLQVKKHITAWIPQAEKRQLLRPLPLDRRIVRRELTRMPAAQADDLNALGARKQIESGDLVLPLRGLAIGRVDARER